MNKPSWVRINVYGLSILFALFTLLYQPLARADTAPDIQLTDHHGQPFALHSLRGKAVLLFFGYTHCPAICPESLSKMAQVLKLLEQDKQQTDRVAALFISVDPERDTVARLAEYIPRFSTALTGLTGTPAQIEQVAHDWHIQYKLMKKTPDAKDYMVDHNANIMVLGTEGQLVSTIPYGLPASHILQVVRGVLEQAAPLTDAAKPATALTPAVSSWRDRQGSAHSVEEYRGKPLLINFWASWCSPCRAELPALNRIWKTRAPEGLQMLAVNVGDNKAAVDAFLQDFPIDFPVLLDESGASLPIWQVKGMPTTVLLDKDGKLIWAVAGEREWDSPEMLAIIQRSLK